jgi:hypothetical protein
VPSPTATSGDADPLNFALEYLEAEFYSFATTGASVSCRNRRDRIRHGGPTSGGNLVTFSDTRIQTIAKELVTNAQAHIKFLQSMITSLGGRRVAKPAINLGALALGFAKQNDFQSVARVLQDEKVSVHGSILPQIQNRAVLGSFGRMLTAEAEAGAVRRLAAQNGSTTTSLDRLDRLPPPVAPNSFRPMLADSQRFVPRDKSLVSYWEINPTSPPADSLQTAERHYHNLLASGNRRHRRSIRASPNPVPVSAGSPASTTITFNVPGAQSTLTPIERSEWSPTHARRQYRHIYHRYLSHGWQRNLPAGCQTGGSSICGEYWPPWLSILRRTSLIYVATKI